MDMDIWLVFLACFLVIKMRESQTDSDTPLNLQESLKHQQNPGVLPLGACFQGG